MLVLLDSDFMVTPKRDIGEHIKTGVPMRAIRRCGMKWNTKFQLSGVFGWYSASDFTIN